MKDYKPGNKFAFACLILAALFLAFILLNNNALIQYSALLFVACGIILTTCQRYLKYLMGFAAVLIGSALLLFFSYSNQQISIIGYTIPALLFAAVAYFGGLWLSKKNLGYAAALLLAALFPLMASATLPLIYISQNIAILGYYLLISIGISVLLAQIRWDRGSAMVRAPRKKHKP